MAKRQLAEAVEHFRVALSLDADFADAQFNLGGALQALGQTGDAVNALEKAVALRPQWADGADRPRQRLGPGRPA